MSAFFGTTTLLPDGEVLATGSSSTGTTALYDPTTNSWTATGSLNVPRMARPPRCCPTVRSSLPVATRPAEAIRSRARVV